MKKNSAVQKKPLKQASLPAKDHYYSVVQQRLKDTMKGQSFVQNKPTLANSQSMLSLVSNQTAGSQCTTANLQKSFQRRLSLNSVSAQSKTPHRSSLNSTKQKIDVKIDKSSDLVHIKNGYFSHNRKKSTPSSALSNKLVNPSQSTHLAKKPITQKTIKSSTINNQRHSAKNS